MIVIGAGPIGIELAQAYQRLGARVTVIGDRILPRDEREVAGLAILASPQPPGSILKVELVNSTAYFFGYCSLVDQGKNPNKLTRPSPAPRAKVILRHTLRHGLPQLPSSLRNSTKQDLFSIDALLSGQKGCIGTLPAVAVQFQSTVPVFAG